MAAVSWDYIARANYTLLTTPGGSPAAAWKGCPTKQQSRSQNTGDEIAGATNSSRLAKILRCR
jgi:hypothetical protein